MKKPSPRQPLFLRGRTVFGRFCSLRSSVNAAGRFFFTAPKPSLTHPELSFILPHDGWMGRAGQSRARNAARPKSNFITPEEE